MILTFLPQEEALTDLVSIGFTEDVKKGALGRTGGTLEKTGDPLKASPVSALGPLVSHTFLLKDRSVQKWETESGMLAPVVVEYISTSAF